jgi:hypothetical protein
MFIYCNWFPTRWQWSLQLHKKGQGIRKKSKGQRIHKIERKILKTKDKFQKSNTNLNALKHNQGRMTMNRLFQDKYANNETTYCKNTLIHKYT